MILNDILSRRNGRGRLLFITRIAAVAELCMIRDHSLMLALQSSEIGDVVAMLAVRTDIDEASREKASYADLERLVRSVRNLSLTIDQAASYIKSYESSMKELLDLYESEEVVNVIRKHDKDCEVNVD